MEKEIYVVHWEGPFHLDEASRRVKKGHVIYALYGAHHSYGTNVLLYIGRTETSIKDRLAEHEWWIQDEYDDMTLRVASVGPFLGWKKWPREKGYRKAPPALVKRVEALLVHAHQPAYNTMNKETVDSAKGLRLFNAGKLSLLLPEVSYLYHWGD